MFERRGRICSHAMYLIPMVIFSCVLIIFMFFFYTFISDKIVLGILFRCARFQASAVLLLRSLLFWDVARPLLVVSYRRFGTFFLSSGLKKFKILPGLFDP